MNSINASGVTEAFTPRPTDQRQVDDDYRERVMGCWLGKAVGGTLGQTFEGLEGPLDADFYHPVPQEMVPNDDLDLQVLYACVIDKLSEPVVDRHVIAQAWADHVEFPWNEYGVAMRNQAEGLVPPFTGSFDNWFVRGEGAAIRSELWACLAPGDADRAGRYAYEDACFDHDGDGIDAAVFLARLQSMAFVESDSDVLIDGALSALPAESGIRSVVEDTRRWVRAGLEWTEVREKIMHLHGSIDFTDVRKNTGFVILGWLAGRTFSERICITNNCGEDTDSTTASVGALLGILQPDAIDEKWLTPIGNDLVLNPEITGIEAPPTLDAFTDLVVGLRDRLPEPISAAATPSVDLSAFAIPVDVAWSNTTKESWAKRDSTELPPPGAAIPAELSWTAHDLPGTWVELPRADFRDRILFVRYQLDSRGRRAVRVMFNCTEHYRMWLDGEFLHAAQGTQQMFPAPHMAQVGQFVDIDLDSDRHELVVAVKRPPAARETAEWVIAVTERPSQLWIPHALRPGSTV